jgi:hypothetical protein
MTGLNLAFLKLKACPGYSEITFLTERYFTTCSMKEQKI